MASGKYEELQRDLVAQVGGGWLRMRWQALGLLLLCAVALARSSLQRGLPPLDPSVLHASGLWQPSCNPPRPATGFAELACADPTRPYVRPEILADGQTEEIVLEGCRHPCVEAQEGIAFVANDCKCADSCACPPT